MVFGISGGKSEMRKAQADKAMAEIMKLNKELYIDACKQSPDYNTRLLGEFKAPPNIGDFIKKAKELKNGEAGQFVGYIVSPDVYSDLMKTYCSSENRVMRLAPPLSDYPVAIDSDYPRGTVKECVGKKEYEEALSLIEGRAFLRRLNRVAYIRKIRKIKLRKNMMVRHCRNKRR